MLRIGKAPIAIPAGVTVTVDEKTNTVTVKGLTESSSRPSTPTSPSRLKTAM